MKLQGKETLDCVSNHLRKDSSTTAYEIGQKNTAGVDSVRKIMSGSGLRKKYYERTGGFFFLMSGCSPEHSLPV